MRLNLTPFKIEKFRKSTSEGAVQQRRNPDITDEIRIVIGIEGLEVSLLPAYQVAASQTFLCR